MVARDPPPLRSQGQGGRVISVHCAECGVHISGAVYAVMPLATHHWLDKHGESYDDSAFLDDCTDEGDVVE